MTAAPGRLVSSSEGAIAAVLLALPSAFLRDSPEAADALFAAAAATGGEVLAVTHAASAAVVRARAGQGAAVEAVPDDTPLSVWIQDQSLAFSGSARPRLLAGPRFSVGALPLDLVLDGPPLLDGGNLLVGADYALVGADEFAFWRARRAVPPPEGEGALAAFAADYGLPERIVVVGGAEPAPTPFGSNHPRDDGVWRHDPWPGIVAKGSRQAVFHVDVHVTPAGRAPDGRPRLLVGDPALAARLAGLPPPPEDYAARFDADAAALAAAGFAVLRNPLPAIGIDHAHRRRRTMHLLSANNAWVEAEGVATPRAWVPLFAAGPDDPLAAVDDAMLALWAGLGFSTVPVRGLGALALRNGGLNCASRILSRR
ncbi:hypothetical protein [Oharaeibacter diazotrophicus]|uniref:Agmatine deiminase n=1 Tax=Oharaeibacter diazotrophicus TaxID=1920512 RepID=A0A4R6RMJ8_9HYPH|nr:hypothetical protein [Oharaeibacter diazotrophicus]TDP87395.1 hypothetical protein EDD54_1289 [Oharaeibacter diazotrophicus]BBE70662.1 hypothetical protein OHA_1_00226 [Pleomorphomonas sp. SM30]GLS77408.1 hypothetical protein GCM10007904_27450 [Oharaeibacter diazotrophicus]